MTRAWWPLGPASVMVPAGAILVVVLTMTWHQLSWPHPLWVQTSAEFHQQFALAGIIAASSACWFATVVHAKDRIWMRPRAPRLGLAAATRHLTALVCWFVGAYLVALTPLVVSTVGGLGTPDPLAMISGVLAMVAATALGYALGAAVPSVVMVPLVAIGFYALLIVGEVNGERFATVAPALFIEPDLGERESLPLLAFRIALFVVIAAAATAMAAAAMTRVNRWRSAAAGAVYLLLPAALITVSLVRQPVVYVTDAERPALCEEHRGIRYCVHAENQPRLAELVRDIDQVIERFGTKPANIDQVWDRALTSRPAYVDQAHGIEIAWLEPDGTMDSYVAMDAAGIYACDNDDLQNRSEDLMFIPSDVGTYLETGEIAGTLSGMSVSEIRAWLAKYQVQLQTCTLTEDQLPR